jgi:hypothetical protein
MSDQFLARERVPTLQYQQHKALKLNDGYVFFITVRPSQRNCRAFVRTYGICVIAYNLISLYNQRAKEYYKNVESHNPNIYQTV